MLGHTVMLQGRYIIFVRDLNCQGEPRRYILNQQRTEGSSPSLPFPSSSSSLFLSKQSSPKAII